MRMMGVTANGACVSGTPDTLVGYQAPTDSGATWMYAGTTADGKPVLTQGTVPVDPQLQQYISMYGGSASPAQVPTGYNYDAPPSNGSGLNHPRVTGQFTQFNSDDVSFMRSTTADAASMVSTNAGRFGSAAAAAASVPSPYAPLFDTAAFAATATGMAADAVVQMVQPNVGQYYQNNIAGIIGNAISSKVPGASPAVNELANKFNDSSWCTSMQNYINSTWGKIANPGGE